MNCFNFVSHTISDCSRCCCARSITVPVKFCSSIAHLCCCSSRLCTRIVSVHARSTSAAVTTVFKQWFCTMDRSMRSRQVAGGRPSFSILWYNPWQICSCRVRCFLRVRRTCFRARCKSGEGAGVALFCWDNSDAVPCGTDPFLAQNGAHHAGCGATRSGDAFEGCSRRLTAGSGAAVETDAGVVVAAAVVAILAEGTVVGTRSKTGS